MPAVARAQTVDSLTPDTTAVPIPTFQTVIWTAAVSGGTGPLSYQFWRFDAATGWTLAQDYSPSATYTWTPSSTNVGEHALQVWVRNAGSTAAYDAWGGTGMFLVGASVALQGASIGPVSVGSTRTWTAVATGLLNPVFEFWRLDADGWTLVQPYSSVPSYAWTVSAADVGEHVIQVWAREASSVSPYDAWSGTNFFSVLEDVPIVASAPKALSTLPASVGMPLTFVAPATGGVEPLEYEFWRFDAASGWKKVQEYGPASTYTWWTPGTHDVGSHALQVWVRSVGSSAPYDAWAGTSLFDLGCPVITVTTYDDARFPDMPPHPSSILPPPTCTVPNCPLFSSAYVGSTLTLSADVCGGTGAPLEYQFWRSKVGVTDWEIVQDFSSAHTFTWTSSSLPSAGDAGYYLLQSRVRRVGFAAVTAFEAIGTKAFLLGKPTSDLGVSITSTPTTAQAGTSATLSYRITNQGPVASASCTARYGVDAFTANRGIPSLAPSQSLDESVIVTMPAAPGGYYFIVDIDCTPNQFGVAPNHAAIALRIVP